MNSEEISITSMNPFIQKFVFEIIQSIRIKNLSYEEKHVIHADMVPKTSERVMQASLKEKIVPGTMIPVSIKKRDMTNLIAPIQSPRTMRTQAPQIFPRTQMPQQQIQVRQMTPPQAPKGTQIELNQDYGKITPLLNDPSISTIECQGMGIPITIIRAGQKQMTKINLSQRDIKEILEKISEKVHIPLLEGVFRAAVDNFSINAVISEMIGSRFIIKKQTAYAMLEK
ncbi:MAG: hypothetical protein OEL87_03175 [Nanoarchaeota archaeon]|nr:hypothetical protein [Nanoarchaeota archaeon]